MTDAPHSRCSHIVAPFLLTATYWKLCVRSWKLQRKTQNLNYENRNSKRYKRPEVGSKKNNSQNQLRDIPNLVTPAIWHGMKKNKMRKAVKKRPTIMVRTPSKVSWKEFLHYSMKWVRTGERLWPDRLDKGDISEAQFWHCQKLVAVGKVESQQEHQQKPERESVLCQQSSTYRDLKVSHHFGLQFSLSEHRDDGNSIY